MEILKQNQIGEAAEMLKKGKILVFPTETSYGLGCDAANQDAVNKIFQIKGRTEDKPLLVVVPSVAMAKKYLLWNNTIDNLAKKFWPASATAVAKAVAAKKASAGKPGPLTVVGKNLSLRGAVSDEAIPKFGSASRGIAASSRLYGTPRNDILANGVISADGTIAVRVTAFPALREIAEKLGRPVVATSANLSGAPALYSAKEIIAAFAGKKWQPDFILDYGILPKNLPSTIVSAINDELKILRQGELKII